MMTIYIRNGIRFNIDAPQTIDGVQYANFRSDKVRKKLDITEVAEPAPPADYSEDRYFRTEIGTTPYVVYAPKLQSQIEESRWLKIRATRDQKTEDGILLNGAWMQTDTRSRQRIVELILIGGKTVQWRNLDGGTMTMNTKALQDYLSAVIDREQVLRTLAETKRADGSDPFTGWPDSYADERLRRLNSGGVA